MAEQFPFLVPLEKNEEILAIVTVTQNTDEEDEKFHSSRWSPLAGQVIDELIVRKIIQGLRNQADQLEAQIELEEELNEFLGNFEP